MTDRASAPTHVPGSQPHAEDLPPLVPEGHEHVRPGPADRAALDPLFTVPLPHDASADRDRLRLVPDHPGVRGPVLIEDLLPLRPVLPEPAVLLSHTEEPTTRATALCDHRMWGDPDGLRCTGEHHPAHTYAASAAAPDAKTDEGDDD